VTLVDVAPFSLYQAETHIGLTTSTALDAVNERSACIFTAPKTGTIDRVGFRTSTATTTADRIVTLETLNASGQPSGTLWGTNTTATVSVTSTDDDTWFEVTLTAGASVTQGDRLALVVSAPGASPGNSVIMHWSVTGGGSAFPYVANNVGVGWAKTVGRWFCGAVRYSDTTWPTTIGLYPLATGTGSVDNSVFTTASTPDERGNKITIPFACKVGGAWAHHSAAQTGDFTWKLYDSGTTVLASKAIDGDYSNASGHMWHMFGTEVTLNAGDVVRLTKLPTSATNVANSAIQYPTGLLSASPMGASVQHTHRTDAGSWTDVADKQSSLGLIITAVSDDVAPPSDTGQFFAVL
jgi:hypothetical protein